LNITEPIQYTQQKICLYTSARTPQPTSALIQEPLGGIRINYISKSCADNQKMCVYNPNIDTSLDVNRR